MKKFSIVSLSLIGLGFVCSSLFLQEVLAETKNLFKIERSKNANVVMYDVRINDDNSINKEKPIDSYWILHAKNGQREEITTFEKKAYGYTITKNSADSYDLVLKAMKDKHIRIAMVNGTPKAEILINNEKAYLSSVYVSASDGLIPKVSYLLLTGKNVNTGETITEKIVVKK